MTLLKYKTMYTLVDGGDVVVNLYSQGLLYPYEMVDMLGDIKKTKKVQLADLYHIVLDDVTIQEIEGYFVDNYPELYI